ncbi:unnamed protein product [Timema podura]|uniref:Intraflagellar transport protein 22 homolog n=1 Tax=Timema podura TaxID=61482 RepID=A0ABN7NY81_TIMPD|nr:unnamed protein product [Timema podura]
MIKLKILFVGPCASGKTTIANLLADATENSSGDYHPTQGVRILEFESPVLNVNNKPSKAEVELWDCSGDHKFEGCWPALQKDAQGLVFVYNPSAHDHSRELELLYNYFVIQTNFSPKNCLVIAYQKQTADREAKNITKLCEYSWSWYTFTDFDSIQNDRPTTSNIIPLR